MEESFPDKPIQPESNAQAPDTDEVKTQLAQMQELARQLSHELKTLRDHQAGLESTVRSLQLELSVKPNRTNKRKPIPAQHTPLTDTAPPNSESPPHSSYSLQNEDYRPSWVLIAALIILIPVISYLGWQAYTQLNDMKNTINQNNTSAPQQPNTTN